MARFAHPEPQPPKVRCPECHSTDVSCVDHPTAKGWHVYECQACGYEGGDHKAVK